MDSLEQCMEKLDKLTNDFINDTLDDTEKKIVELLNVVIVIEKESITKEILFNQLKENYFNDDNSTIEFINNLYVFEKNAISELLNMFIDEINSEDLTSEEIDSQLETMRNTLRDINPEYINLLNEKL